jgi:hypothetical protein
VATLPVPGATLSYEPRGTGRHALEGVEGDWQLLGVVRPVRS